MVKILTSLIVAGCIAGAIAAPRPAAAKESKSDTQLLKDIYEIQKYWGTVKPYADNPTDLFGVKDAGIPDGCAVEQSHILQRHAARGPTSAIFDGANNEVFVEKLIAFFGAHPDAKFTGPLEFLNTWSYQLNSGLLLPLGASNEFHNGASFWTSTGRLLYNAPAGTNGYNASFVNGTARPKPVARIVESAKNWAAGFFGVENSTALYDLVIIPEGGTENNTLAAYDGCVNSNVEAIGYIGDNMILDYAALYHGDAVSRLSAYVPAEFDLNTNDTYAWQTLCAYEYSALGSSDFCYLFTKGEWEGFEYSIDIDYFYGYSFGNPTGRSQGIGWVQELYARLNKEYITIGNTSVNTSYTDNAAQFPLDQPFYLDVTHDDIELSVITALSLDYFKPTLPIVFPPPANRTWILSQMTPFAGHLRFDVVGCKDAAPQSTAFKTLYTQSQYGYNSSNAPHKFLSASWNNARLPLSTIRGGLCPDRGDGFCPLSNFLSGQKKAEELANYQFVCFGNYTAVPKGFKGDGTVTAADFP